MIEEGQMLVKLISELKVEKSKEGKNAMILKKETKDDKEEMKNIAKNWLIKSFPEVDAFEKIDKMSEKEITSYVGKKSINYYGCYTCHNIDGFENSKPKLSRHLDRLRYYKNFKVYKRKDSRSTSPKSNG